MSVVTFLVDMTGTIPQIAAFSDEMTTWRRHLHQHPELDLACHDTARFVAERLTEFGVDQLHTGLARTGIVALIEGQGPGPAVGLRADMDALPILENSDAEWQSNRSGAMHACGHDGHMTMRLGAAKYLCETRNFFGKVAPICSRARSLAAVPASWLRVVPDWIVPSDPDSANWASKSI